MRRIGAAIAILAALQVPTHSNNSPAHRSPDGDGTEMMRKVVDKYQSLSTYSDKGTSTELLSRTGTHYKIAFETLFKRPNKLRFAWTQEFSRLPGYKQRNVIWCDGTNAWSSYSFYGNEPERKKDLAVAVAGATGASHGAAHMIPRLLTNDVRGFRLDGLRDLKVAGTDTAEGTECVVLVGYYATGDECKVWIGSKDYLIRRIFLRSKEQTREEVRTEIMVDQDIADSRFSEQGR